MMQSRNWKRIERLPEAPGVVKMTSTGYWLDGQHVRTIPEKPQPQPEPRPFRWWKR